MDIIVPDAAPLITLAVADRLDLLQSFERPVKVLDVVRAECLLDPTKLGHAELEQWFDNGDNQHQIVPTPLIHAYEAAMAEASNLGTPPLVKGMGDATLMWFTRNFTTFDPGSTTLVMTDDSALGNHGLDRRAHVLYTRAFLKGLENIGVIQSATAIIQAVQKRGRKPSRSMQDRRGIDGSGDTTDWRVQAAYLAGFNGSGP